MEFITLDNKCVNLPWGNFVPEAEPKVCPWQKTETITMNTMLLDNKRELQQKSKKGITLVELIVVILILGILAAIAVPSLVGYIDRARAVTQEAEARQVAQAVMSMFVLEGIDPQTASRSSFYSSGNYNYGRADLLDIVANLTDTPVGGIYFSASAGEWWSGQAGGAPRPSNMNVFIHLTDNVHRNYPSSPAPSIDTPGANNIWTDAQAKDADAIYLCVRVGDHGYYQMRLK